MSFGALMILTLTVARVSTSVARFALAIEVACEHRVCGHVSCPAWRFVDGCCAHAGCGGVAESRAGGLVL